MLVPNIFEKQGIKYLALFMEGTPQWEYKSSKVDDLNDGGNKATSSYYVVPSENDVFHMKPASKP